MMNVGLFSTSRCGAAVDVPAYIGCYWGKAQPTSEDSAPFHPLAYHMLDVAAVAQALLTLRPHTRGNAAYLLGVTEAEALTLLPLIAGLHDLGKFGRAFQNKVPELRKSINSSDPADFDPHRRHDADGWLIWEEAIGRHVSSMVWPADNDGILDTWMMASVAHHGRPICREQRSSVGTAFGPAAEDARAFTREMARLLVPAPITAIPTTEKRALSASHWVAGFVTLADWIGSRQVWFPYCLPHTALDEYWMDAREKADKAVICAGLKSPPSASPKTFAVLTGTNFQPTPLQQWAESERLPSGPVLIIVEDMTGSGKTEAAQMLVHRLMASGLAAGAYWAMPTQATANAMYKRQASMIRGLFADGSVPLLALAHGQAALSAPFQASILAENAPDTAYGGGSVVDDAELPASAACTDFLADDKRLSLLADVGAGTIDQALLGVLPSKFNTMRLFGLAQKVLVLDEAHAYDAYVQAETEGLLTFQAALGGSAVILSATLPMKMRESYARAWQRGQGISSSDSRLRLANNHYPLATIVCESNIQEFPLKAAARSFRRTPVSLVHREEDVLASVINGFEQGGAVAWIRNTVDDALKAAGMLRSRGIEPLVFHARFAQCDRQAREAEIMSIFGPKGVRAERNYVLIATQVVEQSLDLDFDFMASDLAPIDLLIQRAGRLRRHEGRDRPESVPAEFLVLSPEAVDSPDDGWIKSMMPGTAFVYPNPAILWRTARALDRERAIIAPEALRPLIEEVYDGEIPEELERAVLRAEGIDSASRSQGQQNALRPQDGYSGDQVQWQDERKLRTRLADKTQTIRLAKLTSDGGLVAYADASSDWKAWALSEIRVRTTRIPLNVAAPTRFMSAIGSLRATWRRFEQDIPILVLEPSEQRLHSISYIPVGSASEAQAIYSKQMGLEFVT